MTITLTTFVPGTKAKADEVNANFSVLKDAINEKAAIDGDSTQTFSVAEASQDQHAVNKSQLDDLSNDLTAEINKMGTKFCVKSGNITNGKGHLFNYDVLEITPLVGGAYEDLVIVDYEGIQTAISSVDKLELNGISNGNYNIFINTDGELYILNNTIYRQPARPTMIVNDIWFNTGIEPFKCIKYSGTSDTKFSDVPLGRVTVKNNAITAIETFPFNQNGHDINSQTALEPKTNLAASVSSFVMPDYQNGSSKSFSTVYQTGSSGYLHIVARFGGTFYVSSGNADSDTNYTWTALCVNYFGDQGFTASTFFPVPKDMYYKVIVTNTNGSSLNFFPCLGV